MSEATTRVRHAEALAIARELVGLLRPACDRIEIAGSLRRGRPDVGDIEIVAISKQTPTLDLFGEPVGATLDVAAVIDAQGWPVSKGGDKYKQFSYQGMKVDLFLTTPEQWGMIYLIRTGSGAFVKQLVTSRFAGGLMPGDMRCDGGRLWRRGAALHTPEEADVFRALALPWIPPQEREVIE